MPNDSSFDKDLKDLHLIYDYDAQDAQGNPEKWRYEMWFFSKVRLCFTCRNLTRNPVDKINNRTASSTQSTAVPWQAA